VAFHPIINLQDHPITISITKTTIKIDNPPDQTTTTLITKTETKKILNGKRKRKEISEQTLKKV
jgi:hypothetical protein